MPNHLKQFAHDKLKNWFDNKENLDLLHEGEVAQIQRVIDYIEVVDKGHITTENDMEKHFHDFKSFYEQNQNTEITLSNGQKAKLSDIAGGHPEKMTLEDMKNLVTFHRSQVSCLKSS